MQASAREAYKRLTPAITRISSAARYGLPMTAPKQSSSRSKTMKLTKITLIAAAALLATAATASTASAQRGPVAGACASDLQRYCKGVPHVNRAARNCLEEHKDRVTASCRRALDSTGYGRGMGRGRWNNGN
jgi:hypothetical protein